MIDKKPIETLKQKLGDPLPGWDAQKDLMPESRKHFELPKPSELYPAAVLIALFPQDGEWVFPLIRRTQDGYAHSGQIALPGGRKEGQEKARDTALREAFEEVNLPQDQINIIGKMSQLPIPVSKHMVQPLVGYLDEAPDLKREPLEVDEILIVRLKEFCSMGVQTETRQYSGIDFEVPYFDIQGHKVWGATGMILSEFRRLTADLY